MKENNNTKVSLLICSKDENITNMWRAMGELWASYGRAMGELWATIARHIFATLTLTTACGTVYAPLELSICTTMSMNGNVPPFTP